MFDLHTERIGSVAVIQCEGRMVHSDAVFNLREATVYQRGASAVLLDFSELDSIGGGGVGMLVFLREWARCRGIQLWLFDPPSQVRRSLKQIPSAADLKVASMDEVLELLQWEGPRRTFAPSSPQSSAEQLACGPAPWPTYERGKR
jgi:anti-anti-sigma regulatory factor